MRLYLAGPLFTAAERAWLDALAARLRADAFDCFVPHERFDELAELSPEEVFRVDAEGVRSASALVAWLDGPAVDDGTACEIGLFYGLMRNDPSKKGTVGLITDLRSARKQEAGEGYGLNLFVLGCIEAAATVCASIDDVLQVLEGWRS